MQNAHSGMKLGVPCTPCFQYFHPWCDSQEGDQALRASLVGGTRVLSLPEPQDMVADDIIVICYLKNNLKKPGHPKCFETEFVILSIRAWCAVGRICKWITTGFSFCVFLMLETVSKKYHIVSFPLHT